MKTHWHMPNRHIRAVQVGDLLSQLPEGIKPSTVKDIKKKQRSFDVILESGRVIAASAPQYDNCLVDVIRPRAKFIARGTNTPAEQ